MDNKVAHELLKMEDSLMVPVSSFVLKFLHKFNIDSTHSNFHMTLLIFQKFHGLAYYIWWML